MNNKYIDLPERSHPDYMKLWARKNKQKIKLINKRRRDKMTVEEKRMRYEKQKDYQKDYRKDYYKLEKNVKKRNEKQWEKRGILNLNWEIYNKTLLEQNNKCKICNEDMKKPHSDHNHKTGKFRALLCAGCNLSLGRYEKYKNKFENYIKEYNV